MSNNVEQSNNVVIGGDIIGRDKIYKFYRDELALAVSTIRDSLSFDPNCDEDNTTLKTKLKSGKLNVDFMEQAIRSKLKTLDVLLTMIKSENGKGVISDIYENLVALISSKFISTMEEDDLLKTQMDQIYNEFTILVKKYEKLISIDEAFLHGLLFIATSNCVIKWKVEDQL